MQTTMKILLNLTTVKYNNIKTSVWKTPSKQSKSATDLENIFALHTTNRGLVSKLYKELMEIYKKKQIIR